MFHFQVRSNICPVCQQASAFLMHAVHYGTTSPATSPHLMFINDNTVASS